MMTLPKILLTRLTLLLAVTSLVLVPFSPDKLHAAEQDKKFKLLFSDKANDPAPRESLPLRPTVRQQLFVYVQNTTAVDDTVVVEVQSGGAKVDGTVQSVPVKAGAVALVKFGKQAVELPAPPPPTAPVGDKPPAGKPPAKPGEPALDEVKGALQVVVHDKDDKEVYDSADLELSPPSKYIEVVPKGISYDPKPSNGKKNQLTVKVKASDTFAGPRCRIDLVLRPDRIPGLIDSPRKEGTRGGFISKPGGELVLTAENLQFQEGVDRNNGLVYLTIDGWERAYTFSTTFPADEGQEGKPTLINTPLVRLDVPAVVSPGKPIPVGLEVDAPTNPTVELGFDRDNDGQFQEANDEIMKFTGNRRVQMLMSAAGPGGCLLFQPEIQDWKTEVDATGVVGKRELRVRLLQKDGREMSFLDAGRATLEATPGEVVSLIQQPVVLDGSPPENVKLVNFPATLPRGADLPVQATGADPDSDIKQVVFFVGKPGEDGGPPPMAVKAPGKLIDKENNLWAASLAAPTDAKGKVDVSVQFTNGANLTASDTVTIQLVDPPPPAAKDAAAPGAAAKDAAPKPGSIAGTVLEGTLPQPNMEVKLLDAAMGVVKDTAKTDDKGKYLFKDVAAGSYKVTAVKTVDSTKGETGVQVVDGQKKTDVDVKLLR